MVEWWWNGVLDAPETNSADVDVVVQGVKSTILGK